MKIALVCNEYPPHPHGGIGTFVHSFAHALVDAGHQVFVLGVRPEAEDYVDGDVRVRMIGHRMRRGVSWLTRRLQFWRFVRSQVKSHGIEIVETTDFLGLLPFSVGCPVVVRLHLSATALSRQNGQRPALSNYVFESRQLSFHGNWIAMTRNALAITRTTFRWAKARRIAVISPPIDLPTARPAVSGVPYKFVLYAGFVQRFKGAITLAQAAKSFLEEFPSVHLVYAGAVLAEQGVAVDQIIRETLGPELSPRAHFLGYVDRTQVLALMAKAQVFAFPSQLETFGLVVAEAMLQGCPVVVSNGGPFPEFVRHEETGLLVDPNDVGALNAAVVRLLRDRALADRLASQGQAHVANTFSRERHLGETLGFYETCIRDA